MIQKVSSSSSRLSTVPSATYRDSAYQHLSKKYVRALQVREIKLGTDIQTKAHTIFYLLHEPRPQKSRKLRKLDKHRLFLCKRHDLF